MISKQTKKALRNWEPINERIITARFYSSIKKSITIVQCYAPTEDADDTTKDTFYNELTAVMNKVPQSDVLILSGDFNAKIGANNDDAKNIMGKHGMGSRNDNGELFVGFCQEFNLVIGGSLFPHKDIHKYTWTSPNGYTKNQIDHICIRQRWKSSLIDVRTKRGADIDSDHELVLALIKLKLNKLYKQHNKQATTKRYDLKMLSSEWKKKDIADSMREMLSADQRIGWEETCKSINNIAEANLGYANKNERKIWISDNTWNLIQRRNILKVQSNVDNGLRAEYRAIAKAVKRSARADKRKYLESLADEAEKAAGSNNMRQLFQIIGRLGKQNFNQNKPIMDINGQLLTSTEQQTQRWKDHFETTSNINPNEESEVATGNTYQSPSATEAINIDPPCVDEIATAIKAMKRNKAPGDDGIPSEILQVDPLVSAEILLPFIVETWQQEQLPESWKTGIIIKLPKMAT
ncbi:uncharacterized protein [Musca autumnalis]|uniref:uncharacterized protein n=1 Tax=Musca autumnalis TaxID=221902 RepID=UPI003CEE3FBE